MGVNSFIIVHDKLNSFIVKFHGIKLMYEAHEKFKNLKIILRPLFYGADPQVNFTTCARTQLNESLIIKMAFELFCNL